MALRIAILCSAPRWTGPARTAAALTKRGADVCIIAPPDSYAAKTKFKRADIVLPLKQIDLHLPAIIRIVAEEFGADALLAGDDAAFGALVRLAADPGNGVGDKARTLLARSLPDAAKAALLADDSAFILAQQDVAGAVRAPRTIARPALGEALAFARAVGFPVVVKRAGLASGMGVAVCADSGALEAVVDAARAGSFVLQEFVTGPVYGATVSGVQGGALAGIVFEKYRTTTENGATSVARFDRRADIVEHARATFERYGLSGYAGFDYIIGADGKARFIEINPRVMPTGHFDECFGVDLTGAYLAGLRGAAPPPERAARNEYVALFPNEWMRDPESPFLRQGYHDVPWDDPAVFAAMIDKALAVQAHAETRAGFAAF